MEQFQVKIISVVSLFLSKINKICCCDRLLLKKSIDICDKTGSTSTQIQLICFLPYLHNYINICGKSLTESS